MKKVDFVYTLEQCIKIRRKASEEFMEKMPVIFSKILPKWNYKI